MLGQLCIGVLLAILACLIFFTSNKIYESFCQIPTMPADEIRKGVVPLTNDNLDEQINDLLFRTDQVIDQLHVTLGNVSSPDAIIQSHDSDEIFQKFNREFQQG